MKYFVGLGSNLGDRLGALRRACEELAKVGTVVARSRVFAASPVGGPPQPPFLNAAVVLDVDLEPPLVLAELQRIETALGRVRGEEAVRWGPRTIDLDILLAGPRADLVVRTPGLEIPHPRLHERIFALAPLIDLDTNLLHPTEQRTLKALLNNCQDRGHAVAPTGDLL